MGDSVGRGALTLEMAPKAEPEASSNFLAVLVTSGDSGREMAFLKRYLEGLTAVVITLVPSLLVEAMTSTGMDTASRPLHIQWAIH